MAPLADQVTAAQAWGPSLSVIKRRESKGHFHRRQQACAADQLFCSVVCFVASILHVPVWRSSSL